jgi:hypothetical protein
MILASAMWVVNKKTITYLPVPFFVTLTQARLAHGICLLGVSTDGLSLSLPEVTINSRGVRLVTWCRQLVFC